MKIYLISFKCFSKSKHWFTIRMRSVNMLYYQISARGSVLTRMVVSFTFVDVLRAILPCITWLTSTTIVIHTVRASTIKIQITNLNSNKIIGYLATTSISHYFRSIRAVCIAVFIPPIFNHEQLTGCLVMNVECHFTCLAIR